MNLRDHKIQMKMKYNLLNFISFIHNIQKSKCTEELNLLHKKKRKSTTEKSLSYVTYSAKDKIYKYKR